MSTHTPGPWRWAGHALRPVTPNPTGSFVHTILEVDSFAYGYRLSDHRKTIEESDANKSLIAAAPEMYAALQESETALMRCEFAGKQTADGGIGAIDAALMWVRAALAKAEGK